MLKKPIRLNSDFHFHVTKKYGKKYSFPLFNVYVCKPLNYKGVPKCGVVTSKSFHKNAVKRNRAKRILTELVRINVARYPNDTWVLYYPKQNILSSSYEDISVEFNKALQEIFISR
jgi:ribonuclease P protein component